MHAEDPDSRPIIERRNRAREELKSILSLPPEAALDRILSAPNPTALVRSFSEEDFYYLVHDIGPQDAVPLLALASSKQWEHILDLDVWDKDRMTPGPLTRWLNLLLEADADRSLRWLMRDKTEFIELYLHNNLEVRIREHDQDPSEFGEQFFTHDDTFYVRIADSLSADPGDDKGRIDTIKRFLAELASWDYLTYQNVLLESMTVISAETEEETYRQRNVRLAEKGFVPFEEAVGVYQPLAPEALRKEKEKILDGAERFDASLPVPLSSFQGMDREDLFSESLKTIRSDRILQQLQSEFAGLCNQVIFADSAKIQSREKLKTVVDKVRGYLTIGLQGVVSETLGADRAEYARLIQRFPLSGIFRVGYGQALKLKWRAENWRKQAWFEQAGLPLSFWDEEGMGVLGGLLIQKPRFFDNYRSGALYREFASLEDIRQTETALEEIVSTDTLLSLMEIGIGDRPRRFMTYKGLILTLFARHRLGLSDALVPLSRKQFERFFGELFEPGRPAVDRPRRTRTAVKEALLAWLSRRARLSAHDVSRQLGKTLENVFETIEVELGSVAKEDLDPRFIQLFLVD